MIFDSKNYLYYYRLTPDRRIALRRTRRFFPESSSNHPPQRGNPRRRMVTVYPQLRGHTNRIRLGGTLDFAFDIMPTPANSTAPLLPRTTQATA